MGGREAASLGTWQLRAVGQRWSVEATVSAADEHWVKHSEQVTVELYMGSMRWWLRGASVEWDTDRARFRGEGVAEVRDG